MEPITPEYMIWGAILFGIYKLINKKEPLRDRSLRGLKIIEFGEDIILLWSTKYYLKLIVNFNVL